MRIALEVRVPQRARHPEVDEERAAGLEAEDEVLAPAVDHADALSPELGGDRLGLERPSQARVVYLDSVEATAFERRRDCAPDGLDFGQLRQ